MKKITNDELLDIISESTLKNNGSLWLNNIETNQNQFGFKNTVKDIEIKKNKTLVIAAGPESKKIFSNEFSKIEHFRKDISIVACDGALSTLSKNNCIPDIIVSVDGAQIISKFYKENKEILNGKTVILSTSIHPDVVKICIDNGANIKWVQSFFNNKSHAKFFRSGIPSIKMGGNVGTASFLISSLVLRSNPIGLMGIEFAWSDETPYSSTQYFEKLKKSLDDKIDSVKKHYVHVKNFRDNKTYIADPVYYCYYLMLKEIWDELPLSIKQNTYNLTKAGILNLAGLKNISVEEYMVKY